MKIYIEIIDTPSELDNYIHDMDDKGFFDIVSYGGKRNSITRNIEFELDKKYNNLLIEFIISLEAIDRDQKINNILNENK